MPVRVVVRDGESVKAAMGRLEQVVHRLNGRPSHKHRYGYYEKPSELRRKRGKRAANVRRGSHVLDRPYSLTLLVWPHAALYDRTGPSNSLMR